MQIEEMLTAALVITSGYWDLAADRVPNVITLPSMAAGLFLCALRHGAGETVIRIVLELVLMLIIGPLGITGFGDLKLWMALIALAGAADGTFIFLSGCLVLMAYILITRPREGMMSIANARRMIRGGKIEKTQNTEGYPLAFFIMAAYPAYLLFI